MQVKNTAKRNRLFSTFTDFLGRIFLAIEKVFYFIRDTIWNYPDIVLGENKYKKSFLKFYKLTVPFSHLTLAITFFLILTIIFFTGFYNRVISSSNKTLIEGVVMGADAFGRVQKINKVDPLSPVTVQLEKDLVDLIYEPLIKYELLEQPDGRAIESVTPILAEEVLAIRPGADYQFNLRKNAFWHDGEIFNADDVINTFNIVANLRKSDNAYTVALKQLKWEKLDDFTIRICTKGENDEDRCSKTNDNPIFSNFLELISVKIVPAHLTKTLDPGNYDIIFHEILRSPIGTGKFQLFSATESSIKVVRNDDYYLLEEIPEILTIEFKYFITFNEALNALKNGETHSLAASTSEDRDEISKFKHIVPQLSPVLYNQYWGMYFNLRKDPNGKSVGPDFFLDKRVRQAISSAINRDEIIKDALMDAGEEAFGPISSKSSYFNANAGWYTYNIDKANQLLNEAGWTLKNGAKIRTDNSGREMEFSLYFLESFDRDNIAKIIEQNLLEVGIRVIIDRREQQATVEGQNTNSVPKGWTLEELTSQVLAPRAFDTLIFGMNTFIDPDRYELFHSSQANYPKLNIAGYVGSDESVKVRENKQEGESSTVRVPRVDKLLESARSYDPKTGTAERKADYFKIQELIADDAPVVFLFNPRFIYYHNNTLTDVDLSNVSSIEDRFRNIEKWDIL